MVRSALKAQPKAHPKSQPKSQPKAQPKAQAKRGLSRMVPMHAEHRPTRDFMINYKEFLDATNKGMNYMWVPTGATRVEMEDRLVVAFNFFQESQNHWARVQAFLDLREQAGWTWPTMMHRGGL